MLKVAFRLSMYLFLLGTVIYFMIRRPGLPGVLLVVGASLRMITFVLRFIFGFVIAQKRKEGLGDTGQLERMMDMSGLIELVSILGSAALFVGIFLLIRLYLRALQHPPSAA